MLSDALRLVRNHGAHLQPPNAHMPGNPPLHSSPKKSSLSNSSNKPNKRTVKEKWVIAEKSKRSVSFSGIEEIVNDGSGTNQNNVDDDSGSDLVWDSFSQVEEDITRNWSSNTL